MPENEVKRCYICGSDKFVDNHHYDCKEGQLSPKTIPLCRRCHRTYHDRGVEWFDGEYLDKAIDMENKRRQLIYASLTCPSKRLVLLKREDIRRSDYWNKIHNVVRHKTKRVEESDLQMRMEF